MIDIILWKIRDGAYSWLVYLITSGIAGTAGWGLWLAVRRFLDKRGGDDLLYGALKVAILLFILPVTSVGLYVYCRVVESQHGLSPLYFLVTPFLNWVVAGLSAVWAAGAIRKARSYLRQFWQFGLWERACLPCIGERVHVFSQVCAEMGIRRRVRLMEGVFIQSPCTGGLLRPTIYLPERELTKEELRAVFIHELIHFKHGDYLTQCLLYAADILHWYNPLVKSLYRENRRWSEYYTDYCAARMVGTGTYIKAILNVAIGMYTQRNYISLSLYEEENMLMNRMNRLRERTGRLAMKRGLAAVLALGLALAGSVCTYAGTQAFIAGYGVVGNATWDIEMEEADEIEELEEFEDTVTDAEITEVMVPEQVARSGAALYDWTLKKGGVAKTDAFTKKKGGTIRVTFGMDPANVKVTVGIIDPKGKSLGVSGKGTVTHTFSVKESGSYKVYVKNTSAKTITATGYYK